MKLKSIFLMLSSLLFPACQHQENLQPSSPNLAVWGDDMTYTFLDEDNKDGKRALKIAKKYGDYKNYYPRYRIGNLAILDASTPPPKNVMDANSKTGTVGVIFGDEPRYVTFPNQELLSHFMKRTRYTPNIIQKIDSNPQKQEEFSLRTRINITLLLATGNSNYIQSYDLKSSVLKHYNIEPHEPSWSDENGTLTIIYFRMRGNGMMAPIPTQCTITIDENNHANYTCADLSDLTQPHDE